MIVKRPSNISSSSRGRPEGSIDIAPRAPRRGLPGNTQIRLTPDNPHKMGTATYNRYELYKNEITIGDLRKKGATPQDIREIIQKAYGQLQ